MAKCPYCKKDIGSSIRYTNLQRIINLLKQKTYTIAELSRTLGMNRSTLAYYLQILESKGIIEKNRIEEKVTGRPTIIKIKGRHYEDIK